MAKEIDCEKRNKFNSNIRVEKEQLLRNFQIRNAKRKSQIKRQKMWENAGWNVVLRKREKNHVRRKVSHTHAIWKNRALNRALSPWSLWCHTRILERAFIGSSAVLYCIHHRVFFCSAWAPWPGSVGAMSTRGCQETGYMAHAFWQFTGDIMVCFLKQNWLRAHHTSLCVQVSAGVFRKTGVLIKRTPKSEERSIEGGRENDYHLLVQLSKIEGKKQQKRLM